MLNIAQETCDKAKVKAYEYRDTVRLQYVVITGIFLVYIFESTSSRADYQYVSSAFDFWLVKMIFPAFRKTLL